MSIAAKAQGKASVAVLVIAALAAPGIAGAQGKKLGAYAGTIEVTHTLPTLTYNAKVQVSLPVSSRSASAIEAEALAGEAPDAKVLVTRWDTFHRETSADSGGQFNTTSCSLARPAEIPMMANGVLGVDLRKKTHVLSLTLVSKKDLDFNCTHSRSGAHKKKMGIAMTMGTGYPGMHFESPLPFQDAARLAGKHTLKPMPGDDEHGPLVQVWELKAVQ